MNCCIFVSMSAQGCSFLAFARTIGIAVRLGRKLSLLSSTQSPSLSSLQCQKCQHFCYSRPRTRMDEDSNSSVTSVSASYLANSFLSALTSSVSRSYTSHPRLHGVPRLTDTNPFWLSNTPSRLSVRGRLILPK